MSIHHKETENVNSDGKVGQLLNLSLFIMLLAFFIVLNSLSTFDEQKSRPVMESLESTFTSRVQRFDEAPSTTESPEQSQGEGRSIDRIEALFKAQIPGLDYEKDDKNGTMTVHMSFDDLMTEILKIKGTNLQTESVAQISYDTLFLSMLIAVLKTEETGHLYEMDMVLELEDDPSLLRNKDPQALKESVSDIGFVARVLEKENMPKSLMSVGLKKGKPGMVNLLFRPFETFDLEDDRGAILP